MKNKFNVGDIVIGNKLANKYNTTVQGWEGKVTKIINQDSFEAEALSGSLSFSLWSERFDLVKAAEPTEPDYQIF